MFIYRNILPVVHLKFDRPVHPGTLYGTPLCPIATTYADISIMLLRQLSRVSVGVTTIISYPRRHLIVLFCVWFLNCFVRFVYCWRACWVCFVFSYVFVFRCALPNTRRSVSRPEQVRQAGPVGDQEQDVGVAVLVAPRLHQGLHQTCSIPFSAREYGSRACGA